jgi:hypothetical protein
MRAALLASVVVIIVLMAGLVAVLMERASVRPLKEIAAEDASFASFMAEAEGALAHAGTQDLSGRSFGPYSFEPSGDAYRVRGGRTARQVVVVGGRIYWRYDE